MANVAYSPVPEAVPSVQQPNDRMQIEANPAQFGGLIGAGLERFGEGASQAGKFFGEVTADQVTNDFEQQASSVVNHYKSLQGNDALQAQPQTMEQLDGLLKSSREKLSTPEQQLQFDNFSRRYRTYLNTDIGTHYNQQFMVYGSGVNKSSADLALTHIQTNADNDTEVQHGTEDLKQAYVKDAQLHGGGPEMIKDAVTRANRDAFKARTLAIGTKDPAAAIGLLDKNRDLAGTDYASLYNELRSRADVQIGTEAGQKAYGTSAGKAPYAAPNLPVFAQTANAVPGGYSPNGLARTIKIESGGNPNAGIGTSHQGLGQFDAATAARVGLQNRLDPTQALAATQKLAALNAPILAGALGRPPTDAELYLAHQQGAGGAVALLNHPNERAGDLVGDAAIRGNGGNPNAPASAFTSMWVGRFNGPGGSVLPGGGRTMTMPAGTSGAPASALAGGLPDQAPSAPAAEAPSAIPAPPAIGAPSSPPAQSGPARLQPESIKADGYQQILSDPSLNPAQRQHALTAFNQLYAAQQIAQETDAKVRKQRADDASSEYTTRMMHGDFNNIVNQIADDPRLRGDPAAARTLWELAEKHAGDDLAAKEGAYGPGFWTAYKQIVAPASDSSSVSQPMDILRRAGPGGDLTLAGAQKLVGIIGQSKRSLDDAAVNRAKVALLAYAKPKLSFQEDIPGIVGPKDPDGEARFNGQLVPQFEAAFDAWVAAKKDPWQFLTQKNMDDMLAPIKRSEAEMKAARLRDSDNAALNGGLGPIPPPPPDADANAWHSVITMPPLLPSGKPWTYPAWAAAVTNLREHPDTAKQFDEYFSSHGVTAADILGRLPVNGLGGNITGLRKAIRPAQPQQGVP